ncbi:hypothetical protein [Abiotrophia defectiva]
MFKLELRHFIKNHRFVYLLLILPLVTMLGLGLYRGQVSHDLRHQERQQANRLASDLNWSISTMQRQGVSEENPLLVSLKEAEKTRFDYSVAAYYEEWDRVNQDKLSIWRTLLNLNNQGKELLSISRQQIEEELPVIEWQVNYQIGRLDVKTTRESSYLLSQLAPYLLGIPLLLLFSYLVGLPLLRDFFANQQAFLKTLPIPYSRLLSRRLGIFLCLGLGYGLSIAVGWAIYHVLFDQLPLTALLHYPMAPGWPLWQGILALFLFWLGLVILFWLILLLINRWVQELLLVWLGLGVSVTLLAEFSRLFDFYPFYSIFSYWDIYGFVLHQSSLEILYTVLILFGLLLGVWRLIVTLSYAVLKRGRARRRYDLSSSRFQTSFEWLKLLRGHLWWQICLCILAFFLYYGVSQGIQYHQLQAANIAQKSELLKINLSDYRQAYPTEELYQSALASFQRQEALVEELKQGKTKLATEMEYDELKQDVDFLQGKGDRTLLPIRDWIFMPNAYINYQLAEWKRNYGIDFQLPGGPYWTLYIPNYEQSPRSGEDQPPLSIDIAIFESYLARVSKPMKSYTALGIVGNLFEDRLYLGLWVILVIFLVAPTVLDKETGRWRFQATLPLARKHLVKLRQRISLQQVFLLMLGSVILLALAGSLIAGLGHIQLPQVRYLVDGQQWGGLIGQRLRVPSTHQFFEILPSWYYYLEAFLLLVAVTYFINSLCHFVASWVKSTAIYASLVAGILGVGYGATLLLPSLAQAMSPFRYLDLAPVLDGRLSVSLGQGFLTHWTGLVVCGLAGLFLNICLHCTLKGRDQV